MLSTAELDRLHAALGACRAHGCDCTSYEAAGKVGNYPTCKCGHSENVHNHPDGGKAPARKTSAAWHDSCPSCGSKDVWPHDKWTQTCGACGIVFDEEGHTWGDMWLYETDDFDEGLHEGSLRRQAVTTALWPVTGYGDLVHVVLGNPEDTDSAPEATKTALCGQTPWGFNYWRVMPFDGEDYRPVSNAEDARQVTCPTCRRAAETSVRTASRKIALGETPVWLGGRAVLDAEGSLQHTASDPMKEVYIVEVEPGQFYFWLVDTEFDTEILRAGGPFPDVDAAWREATRMDSPSSRKVWSHPHTPWDVDPEYWRDFFLSRVKTGSRKTAAWSAADVVPGKGSWEGSPLYPDGTPIHINDRVLDGHGRPGQVVSIVPDESWRVPGEGPIGVRLDKDEYDPAPAPTYWPHDLTPVDTVYQHHPEGYPRLSLGQARHTALGETRVPAEVDTLREDSCPICGADDYRGDACNSCGFVRPPVIFHDPDTQKARVEDLREPPTPVDLACDACGAVFPATTEQTATASRHHAAFPEDLEKDKATGTTTDQSDPQTPAEPEQAEPTAAEQVRQHQQGDLCPSCGKGTLMPKSEVNGVEADEGQVVSEDGEIEEREEPASEGGGGYTLLPKDDPQAILDLVGGGAPKVASVHTATIPSPYEDEEPKKPEPADDTGSDGPEPEADAEANPVDAGTENKGEEKARTDVQADVPEEVEDAASGGLSDPAGVGPSDGYLVVDTSSAQTFDLATVTAEEIAAYTSAHPEGYLGGTVSGGQLTLEVSTHVTDPDQATGGTVWDVAAGTKVEPEETPQQVAAALTRRLLSYRRPVRCAPTGTERVEEPIPHRLSGRTQKEQSMSTQNPERGGDRRRQSRPQRRQASAEGRPQRPRQGLHQTLSAMEQRMDRMASVIQRQAGEIKELRTGTRVLAAQNEVLRTAALALSETDGSEAALKATAGLRKAAEQGGAKNGEDVALTDESAAAPEATTSVDSDETVATGDVTPDATTDVENTQVAEDQGALNELTDVTQTHTQTGDATGEVQVQKSAPATTKESNPIEESGWTTASKTDSDDERTWAAMHLAKTRKDAGLTNEETMVLAQRLTKDASITVEAMETEAKTLEQVMATKEGSRRPGRNLVPRRADGGAAPSLAGARTASAEEQPSGGDVDVSDAFL